MTVGQSTAHVTGILNLMRGSNYASFTPWLKLHIGDPGPAGTANPSSVTTRKSPVFAAPSGGQMTAPAVSWADWAGSNEVITHVSLWDAESGGNFKQSAALNPPKTVESSDTLNITPTVSQGPLAA